MEAVYQMIRGNTGEQEERTLEDLQEMVVKWDGGGG